MDRKCTDVIVCLLFFLFFCGMFATAAYGYSNGDPTKLITPFDSDGAICGKNASYENYPYQYWPDLLSTVPDITLTLCVAECPTEG